MLVIIDANVDAHPLWASDISDDLSRELSPKLKAFSKQQLHVILP
jgi:hypothetical protein